MCRYLSAIVTRDNVFTNDATDSHEHLVKWFKLNDSTPLETRGWIRVEYAPKENKDYADIEKYILTVDEANTPIWFTDERREQVVEQLRGQVKKAIITDDRDVLLGGVYILAGKCKLKGLVNSRVVVMCGSSKVGVMWDSSNVGVMCGASNVGEMYGSSNVGEMRDSSNVGEMYGSSNVGEMRDSSNVIKDNREVKK